MDDSDAKQLGELIRLRREAEGMSQAALAAEVGTHQQTIEKIEKATTRRSSFLPRILHVLKIDMAHLTVMPKSGANRPPKIGLNTSAPPPLLQGPADLPVHAATEGGRGAVILTTDPVEYVVRPHPLMNVRDAYGVIVVEESMAPEFAPGQIALVHPHLPPRAGATCIFYSQERDGTTRAVIKRLRRVTPDAWHVRQWNPPEGEKQDFSLKRSEWSVCHVTVGRYDSR